MVQDNPIQAELEEMFLFCAKYKHILLFGCDDTSRLFAKYFQMAQCPVEGFIAPSPTAEAKVEPVLAIDKLNASYRNHTTGIIVPSGDAKDIALLKAHGFTHTYAVSEWNRRTIPYKMTPRSKENFWVEVNLADHCNLNCQCCDHFSPLAPPTFLDFDQYVKDLHRLSDLTDNKIGLIKLQGGEPLMNDRLIDFIRVTREIFPDAFICLFTAGLLLGKWGKQPDEKNLWKAVKDYEIEVRWTHYPINLKFDAVKAEAERYGIEWWESPPPFKKGARVWFFSEIGALDYKGVKHSVKHPFWLEGGVAPFRWISCYQFNESIVLRDGRIYTCPMIPYVHFFNSYFHQNLAVTPQDSIDIYEAKSYEEIAEFCTHRVPFCNYCAVHHRDVFDWKQSKHSVDEWTEASPALGDSVKPMVQHINRASFLWKLGVHSLRQNGIRVTYQKSMNLVIKPWFARHRRK